MSLWISFGLGIFVGLMLGNKNFRQKVISTAKQGINSLNRSAKEYNRRQY